MRTPRPSLAPHLLVPVLALLCAAGCGAPGEPAAPRVEPAVSTLFTRLPASFTGLRFENRVEETQDVNVFNYRHVYNGGGVGLGDVDGDGRLDVYLTANAGPNKLFLNRGDWRFEDVTDRAGVAGKRAWATGVSVADVDGDGRLDLYVANAGDFDGADTTNELFVNRGPGPDGVPRFTEEAAAYGLADEGYSTHAVFFDADRDGDLDAYVLNNSFRPVSSFGLRNVRHERHARGGDKLFRQDQGPDGAPRFVDVSAEAGIYGSEIGFGLGITAGDVDGDGAVDLYISNDFFERDYLYLNNGDGTFRETLEDAMDAISLSSMGADLADVDNDGRADLFVTDMLPPDDHRLKTTSSFESWDVYQAKLRNDYHHQFMRNTLQLNDGDGTFTEAAQLAGVHATDWSWGALLADFDLDGHKDLFVANGVLRDVTDQDFIDFLASEETMRAAARGDGVDFLALLDHIPSTPLPNAAFQNLGDRTFQNVAAEWGLDTPSFSNGAAYGDLDGDGDLDLVVNTLNQELLVYRNEADTLLGRAFLQVQLEGAGRNPFGVGAQVRVEVDGGTRYLEQMPIRGFQSSSDPVLTFGLADADTVDRVTVTWPDGRRETRARVAARQRLTFRQADARAAGADGDAGPAPPQPRAPRRFADVTAETGLAAVHAENAFVDFDREGLIPRMVSIEGPRLAVGDVDGDGRDDVYLGGAKEHAGQLWRQRADGRFEPADAAPFAADAISEDVGAAFFDADGDGDLDLYVVSGGNEYGPSSPALRDRLYLNDGRGGFAKADGRLPGRYHSGSVVRPADVDGDGDLDLFVGGRVVPWGYGRMPANYLLRNDGRGGFEDATGALAPALAQAGMVTDAAWADVDGDGDDDLVTVGDWAPVQVFRRTDAGLGPAEPLAGSHGWWNAVAAADLDGDGDVDLALGNVGHNLRVRVSPEQPGTMLVGDFDRNGDVDQVASFYDGDESHPLELRKVLMRQLTFLKKRYPRHAGFAGQTVEDIFTPEERADAETRRVETFATSVALNRGDGTFDLRPLPFDAQLAPVYAVRPGDVDGDGHVDLLLGGNFYGFKPNLGRMAESRGLWLRGDGAGGFTPVPPAESGFDLPGQTRDLQWIDTARGPRLLVARNDAPVLVFAVR